MRRRHAIDTHALERLEKYNVDVGSSGVTPNWRAGLPHGDQNEMGTQRDPDARRPGISFRYDIATRQVTRTR